MARKTKRSTRAKTEATPKPPRKPVVRSTRRARGDQDILDDARLVARVARAQLKGFQKYDADRAQKLYPRARLDAYDGQIRSTSILVGGRRTAAVATAAATRAEEEARAVVYELVTEIRGVVSLGVHDDPDMRKACLVGVKIDARSTSGLVAAAADLQQALEKSAAYRERAAALGISKATLATLIAARRALTEADTSQGEVQGERVATTAEKIAALRAVERETAYVRKVAGRAFRGQPKVLAKFRPKTPRAIARPRKPKGGGTATGGGA